MNLRIGIVGQCGAVFAAALQNLPDVTLRIYAASEWTATGFCFTISLQNGGVPIRVLNFRDDIARPVILDFPRIKVK